MDEATPIDEQDNIDNVVVNLTGEEEISDTNDSLNDSEDTWNVNQVFLNSSTSPESNQSPCCNQMERLSFSSEEMIDDLLQTTPIHESSGLGTYADNEGNMFDDIPESEDEPHLEFMEKSKLQCSSNDQSLRFDDLSEGSKSVAEKEGSMDWNFDDSFEALNKYIVFVDRLLLLRDNSSDIQTFKLNWKNVGNLLSDLDFKYDVSRHIATWIMAVVKHNVQDLKLTIFLREMIKLPDCLFTCKSLTKLRFYGFGRDLTALGLPDNT
ncbi:hypothetical protein MKX03_028525, partial [Papaver bracteatum]